MSGKLLTETITTTFTLTEDKGTGKLVARGEFGRYDTPTQNGRRYPKAIYEREVKKLQEDIKRRRVLAELDHPCLTSDDFRVLTASGWKPFREVAVGDRVWSRVDGKAVLSTVEGVVDQPYSGPAYHVKGRSIEATFTPAHRFLLQHQPRKGKAGKEHYATIAEIVAAPGKYANYAIPKTASWSEAEAAVDVIVPAAEGSARFKNDVAQPLRMNANLFAAFMGIYLAEGHCTPDTTDNYGVFISLTTPWVREYVKQEILDRFPVELVWHEEQHGFYLSDKRIYQYLKPLGDCYSRHIPEGIKALGEDALRELVFWFGIGDGRMVHAHKKDAALEEQGITHKQAWATALRESNATYTRKDVFSVSERLIRDLHECTVHYGGAGTISKIDPDKDYEYAGHTIKAENKVPLYQLHLSNSENIWLDPRFLGIEEVHHEGNIYCLTVTHGNFYLEREGKSFWTGNSDGKTMLQRAAALITEAAIADDGRVLGAAEILDTPNGRTLAALIRHGVEIGVSSRGFGSTKPSESGDGEDVCEDYNLKTWDFVADPAMKSAYPEIFNEDVNTPYATDALQAQIPEALAALEEGLMERALAKAQATLQAAASTDVEAAVAAAREEERERFEHGLIEALQGLRAEVRAELREEAEADGAGAVMATVAQLLRPYLPTVPEDHVAAALQAQRAEITGLREQAEAYRGVAREAGYQLLAERLVAGHPHAAMARELLADAGLLEDEAEVRTRVRGVLRQLEVLPPALNPLAEATRRWEGERKRLFAESKELHGRLAEKQMQLKLAVEGGEGLEARARGSEQRVATLQRDLAEARATADLAAYKAESVAGLTNGRELIGLLEGVASTDEVDRLVRQRGRTTMGDGQLERMRAQLTRSQARPATLEEEAVAPRGAGTAGAGDLADFGLDPAMMRQLSGLS